MRRSLAISALLVTLAASCGRLSAEDEPSPGSLAGDESPAAIDERRLGIYEAVIRSLVEWKDGPVYVYERLCADAGSPSEHASCPGAFSVEEQRALTDALADLSVTFVADDRPVVEEIFDGGGGDLIRVGPIAEEDGEVQVPGSHYCGGLCGGGSVWVVEETDAGWKVTGPAPGEGVWIS